MARLSTCKGCEKKIPKEEKHTYNNKTYCINCYNVKLKEREDYNKLISVILQYFNLDVPTGLILKQIKEYTDTFKYTYAGMGYCLWYIKEVKNLKLESKYGLAMVKFEYENAKSYYVQQENIKKSIVKPIDNTVILKVKKPKSKSEQKLLVNIDELIGGGE